MVSLPPKAGEEGCLRTIGRELAACDGRGRLVGTRPWGWWWFVAGEDAPRPDDPIGEDFHALETVRLAQLGELTSEELTALREEANEARLRVGPPAEWVSGGWREHGVSMDQRDVDLWEAVERARGPR